MILRPKVLIAPLDWGLGHATRCIPIIKLLFEHDIEVILAVEGAVAKLIKEEFPAIVILPIRGYKVKYSKNKAGFFLKMLSQVPGIISTVNQEKKWLAGLVTANKIDAVISDNRFGLSHPKIPCVFITHQLFIQTGNNLLNKIIQKTNYHFINKFDSCWVPDVEGKDNLAGKLSHPAKFPLTPVKYLGILSRCKKINTEKKYKLLILLSGPEPQRTIFENVLLHQLNNIEGKIIIVRGLPAAEEKISLQNDNVIIHNHLAADKLNELMQQADNIIARCGYSTVMDLVTVEQKAILVATPGQTEQEYLAAWLMKKKLFFTVTQEKFDLKQALTSAADFNFTVKNDMKEIKKEIIIEWINKLKEKITSQ